MSSTVISLIGHVQTIGTSCVVISIKLLNVPFFSVKLELLFYS